MSKNCLPVLAILILLFLAVSADAQKSGSVPVRLGIGGNIGATLKDPQRFVAGIDGRLQAPIGNSFSVILTTGYYQFFKNNRWYGMGVIPVKGGLKYFPVKNFYVAGEIGAGLVTNKGLPSSFVYSPFIGVAYANGLDISLKFEDYTNKYYDGLASQLALRIAYGFKL